MGGGEPGGREEEQRTDDQPARPVCGDVECDDEQAEQQRRGAQVALGDEHQDADAPHDHEGDEVARPRQVQAEHASPGQGQVVAIGHQVGGEEHHQEDLGQLSRLEGHGAQVDPDLGAVDALPEARDEGQDQEAQAAPHGPAVPATQQTVVAHDEHDAEQHDSDSGPHGLLGGVVVRLTHALVRHVQALDHGQSEPVEGHRRGQEHRVGPWSGAPHPQVDDDGHRHEGTTELEDLRRRGAGAVQCGQDETAQADEKGDDEKARLGPAPTGVRVAGRDRGGRCWTRGTHDAARHCSGAADGVCSAAGVGAGGVAVGVADGVVT